MAYSDPAIKRMKQRQYYNNNREKYKEQKARYYREHAEELIAKAREKNKMRAHKYFQGDWQVIQDPDPDAPLSPCVLSACEKAAGLWFGTFTPGTIIGHGTYRYTVVGEVGTRQKLEELNGY